MTILQKNRTCSHNLTIWEREVTGNFSGRNKACKAEMRQYRGGRDVDSKKDGESKNELTKVLNQREIFRRQ